MLDRKNIHTLIDQLTATGRFEFSVETNGSWDPKFFQDLAKRPVFLNIAFHPLDVDFDTFYKRVLKIRDAGFNIAMVNMVLDPKNIPVLEQAVSRFEAEGLFVNLSAMQPHGIYAGRTERTERELELIEANNTPLDIKYKILRPPSKGKLCYYPALTYYLQYDGLIRVFCSNDAPQNLFTDGLPPLPREAVPCPYDICGACNEMYRSLADEPLQVTPLTLFTHREYVEEVKAYRKKHNRTVAMRRLPLGLGKLFEPKVSSRTLFEEARLKAAESEKAAFQIPLNGIGKPLPEQAVFGAVDESGNVIEAFSRDRIALSGWAAARNGGSVRQVRILLDSRELGSLENFEIRPEVASEFGRPELAKSGWRTMVYLPALEPGEYELTVQAVDRSGNAMGWPGPRIRIVE
jgi:hypothetical protein